MTRLRRCGRHWGRCASQTLAACALLTGLGCGGGGAGGPALKSVFDLGLLPSTLTSRASIQVANPLATPAVLTDLTQVTGARVDPAALPMQALPGEVLTVPLVVAPHGEGAVEFPIALRFDGGAQMVVRELIVRVTFDAVTWQLSPPSLDFGIVALGEGEERSLQAWNRSALSPVTISDVILPAHFTLATPSLPLTVGPGAAAQFTVRYQPSVAGLHDGTCVLGPGDTGARLAVPLLAGDRGFEGEYVLDLGAPLFTAGETPALPFDVPADTVSVTVEIRGEFGDDFRVAELTGPDGTPYAPRDYVVLPEIGFGLELTSYTIPDTDLPAGQLVAGGGTYTVRFRQIGRSGIGPRARAILERRPGGIAADGRLDLNVWLSNGLALKAATAAADPGFQAALARLSAVLAGVGITLGDVDFYDIADTAFDAVDGSELPGLFALSAGATQRRPNVFLISQSLLVSNGFSARIGGPLPNGTRVSGVVIALPAFPGDDLRGLVLAHELGHYLGLFHPVEYDGSGVEDRISDTNPVVANVMGNPLDGTLTIGQGFVLRRHPHVQPTVGTAKPGVPPATYALPPDLLPAPATWCAHCAEVQAR